MATAGEVWVKIGAQDAGLRAGLNRAKADVNGAASAMGSSLGKLKGMFAGVVAGYAIQRAVRDVSDAALEQEQAVSSVNAALVAQGRYSQEATKGLMDYAGALQKETVYGDEVIASQMALAMRMGIGAGQVKEVTKAAVGLAAITGKDLPTAMGLLVRASNGNFAMLTRYGIKIEETGDKQQMFAQLLKKGASGFQYAQAEAGSAAGKIKQFQNALGDLKEKLGALLLPVIVAVTSALRVLVDWLNGGGFALIKWIGSLAAGIATFMLVQKAITSMASAYALLAAAASGAEAAIGDFWGLVIKGGAAVAAATAVMLVFNKGLKDMERGYADISKQAAETWGGLSQAMTQDVTDLPSIDPNQAKAIFEPLEKPAEEAKDKLNQEAEAIANIVTQNREAMKAEQERRRASIGWVSGRDVWKEAMAGGAQERFNVKGLTVEDKSLKELARIAAVGGASTTMPNMATAAEVRRAAMQNHVDANDNKLLLEQIKTLLQGGYRLAQGDVY